MMAKYKVGELVESERKKVPEKTPAGWSADENKTDGNNIKSWILPLLVGLIVTVVYRYWFKQ